MTKNRIVVLVSLLAIAGSLYSIFHTPARKGEPSLEMQKRYAALGTIVGEETAKVLEPGSTVVLGKEPGGIWATEAQLPGFLKALTDAGVKVQEIYSLTRSTFSGSPIAYLTPELFKDIQNRHWPVDAIILFNSQPMPNIENDLKNSSPRPRVFIIGGYHGEVQPLVNRGVVSWALVSRYEPLPDGTPSPTTGREQFDHSYQILTAKSR